LLHAPDILVRSMSTPQPRGKDGELWQYHSRSDLHSKVACCGVFLDLMATSALLREHVRDRKVVVGVNHPMLDFVNNKKKNLDLVLARPGTDPDPGQARSMPELFDQWAVQLDDEQREVFASLPVAYEGPVGSVLVAMEAKACMTEHSKAGPRLYDELNSSHGIVHASSANALAVGFVMINAAETFVSPDRNRRLREGESREATEHKQPHALEAALRAVGQLPRRSDATARGYDGLGIVVVDAPNDGTPVRLVTDPPAPQPGDNLHYDSMLRRVAGEYDSTFRRI
jgi:hypothetical protein